MMDTLTSPALSSPATPMDERCRLRRISQPTSAVQQHPPVGIARDISIMSASRLIIPATPTSEDQDPTSPPYMYSQGYVFSANMMYLQSNFSPVSENSIPEDQDSASPSYSSSQSTSASSPGEVAHIEGEDLEPKNNRHGEYDAAPKRFGSKNDFVVVIVDSPLPSPKKVEAREVDIVKTIGILPGSAAKDEGERLAFGSFTEPVNDNWTAIESKPTEMDDNFDYASAYYGRQATIGDGANVFEHISSESESEPSEHYFDDDQVTVDDDYDILEDDYASPIAEKLADPRCDIEIQIREKFDEFADTTLKEISVPCIASEKEEKSVSATASVDSQAAQTTDPSRSEPQPEHCGKDTIVLFDGASAPVRCTCGSTNGDTPTTAGTSGSFPFAHYPETDSHDEECLVPFAGGYHCLPTILLQKVTDSDTSLNQSLTSPDFVDSIVSFKSRDYDEEERNVSRPSSAATSRPPASEDQQVSAPQAKDHLDGIAFTDPVQLSLQIPKPPEPVFLSLSWQPATAAPYARPKLPGRPRLLIEPPESIAESHRYGDETPLWWRYIVFPLVSLFSSRITRDAPSRFWLRANSKVETPLAEATTSPERRLEAELRRQKLLWNVMGILLTGVLLGGVVAGVVIYYFGRGGDPGVLGAGKHAAAGAA
ncbi:hypothetical protein POJ06DRAFT_235001 [Lipomyces tetrasporus]|uniref:Uncharacterized protein n=1 Tax=Lipomyces tetrasporus TaxID=54092 RepID=A0AAD7QZ03_9ASCO|nr:uncharacterized protein POJ06DRAFT_235001 [Lipomyces tetrasporus]KAJ8104026.1 hypothetical protein POJ06DRAFT_235001 [Lipomyces tetrasporus]